MPPPRLLRTPNAVSLAASTSDSGRVRISPGEWHYPVVHMRVATRVPIRVQALGEHFGAGVVGLGLLRRREGV